MGETEKAKAFAEHILEECEREGLTIAEALRLPQELKFALDEHVRVLHKSTGVKKVAL